MSRSFVACIALFATAFFTPALRAQDAAAADLPLIQADNAEEVAKAIGTKATIEGRIARVGKTQGGGITFLNFSTTRNGFVGVIFKPAYAGFPDGFDQYRGKTVRISGKVEIYKDAVAQIVIKEPAQIEIVEPAKN